MSIEEHKALIGRWIAGINTQNLETIDTLIDETFTSDFIYSHNGSPDRVIGRKGIKAGMRINLKNSREILVTIEELIAEGESVVARLTLNGTDVATGKAGQLVELALYHFRSGQISGLWGLEVSTTPAEPQDPITVVKAFNEAINAGDLDQVMAFFSADAQIHSPDGKIPVGTQMIREWLTPQMKRIHSNARNFSLAGNTVTWETTISGDFVTQLGAVSFDEINQTMVQDGKVTSFVLKVVGRK